MEALSNLSLSERFTDFGVFILYGLVATLAGGAAMTLLDFAERVFLSGKVSKRQYLWALAATFFLGLFLQWEQVSRELKQIKQQVPVTELQADIQKRDDLLRDKENLIQDLKHEKDLLVLRKEAAMKDAELSIAKLNNQLANKQRRIGELEGKHADAAKRKAIRDQLARFLVEGEVLEAQCLEQVKKAPPYPETKEWLMRASVYVKKEIGSAEATQLTHPPLDPFVLLRHYKIPKEHEILLNTLEAHNNALRNIMAKLALGSQ